MDTIDNFREVYERMSNVRLIEFGKESFKLHPNAQTALKDELVKRDLFSDENFNSKNPDEISLSVDEIRDEIEARLSNGESLDSIKTDLKIRGINFSDMFNKEVEEFENKNPEIAAINNARWAKIVFAIGVIYAIMRYWKYLF